MDLLQLRYFQTVARHEHITRASEELHIAQPTLSMVIARLEENLGVPLFDRVGRQIKLNKFGKVFLHRVERIFLEFEDGKRELSDMLGNENSKVSIAVNNLYPLSKLLEEYLKLYPNTSFHQTMGSTVKMQQQLRNGDVDFCISSPAIEGDYVERIPLLDEEIFLIVPHGHKFANRQDIHLAEAANEPFISLPEGFGIRDLTEKFCLQAGFTPNIVFESYMASNLIDLVNLDLGIALLPIPQWSILPDIIPIAIQIIEPACSRTTTLSFIKGRYLSPSAIQFKEYLISYFKRPKYEKR